MKDSIAEHRLNVNEDELNNIYNLSCDAYQGLKRYLCEEYVTHPLSVAIILSELEADPEVIMAGLLCDINRKGNYEKVAGKLPKKVEYIVELIRKDCENEDVQVIKLAERLHNMRTLEYMDDLIFYEVAMGKRDDDAYLVTGNQKHYPIRDFIVTPSEMMEIIDG